MIRDGRRLVEGRDRRCAAPDLHQPLVDVLQLRVPGARRVAVSRIVFEQVPVVPQVRSAAAGVRDDRIVAVRREEIDHPARLLPGQIQLAVVGVQRSAARLRRWRLDAAAVGQQHIRRVAVDVGEDQILDAAGQKRDAIAGLSPRRFAARDQPIRERRRHPRRLRLQPPQRRRQEHRQAERANGGFDAAALIERASPRRRCASRADSGRGSRASAHARGCAPGHR